VAILIARVCGVSDLKGFRFPEFRISRGRILRVSGLKSFGSPEFQVSRTSGLWSSWLLEFLASGVPGLHLGDR